MGASYTGRIGLTPRGERVLNGAGIVVLVLFALGWTWAIAFAGNAPADARPTSPTRTVTAVLTDASAPTAAYVTDAALEALVARARGASGKLRVKTVLPAEVDSALSAIKDFAQITLTPFSAKSGGRVGLYYIGNWPSERGARGPPKAPNDP